MMTTHPTNTPPTHHRSNPARQVAYPKSGLAKLDKSTLDYTSPSSKLPGYTNVCRLYLIVRLDATTARAARTSCRRSSNAMWASISDKPAV